MRLLVVADKKRFYHLNGFIHELEELGMDCDLIYDLEFLDGFLKKSIFHKSSKQENFEKKLTEFNPDAVLFDRISYLAISVLKKNIPIFVLLRGNYWEETKYVKEDNPSVRKLLSIMKNQKMAQKIFDKCEMILPISNYLKDIASNNCSNKKIKVLKADGRNLEDWYSQPGMNLKHPCIGLLQGAEIWGKAKEMLVLTKTLEKFPNIMFYWAGDGHYRDKILNELGSFENFTWIGNLEYPHQVRQFLTEIDIFLLLSGMEGLGQTIIEAQLMKKPVIATNVGGIPELIEDKKTGFLINQGDSADLINKISLLMDDKEGSNKIGLLGYDFAKNNFTWKNIAENFISILDTSN